MSDNTTLNSGTGGDVVRDLARETSPGVAGSVKTQVVALDAGGPSQNGESIVGPGHPLPTAEVVATSADSPLFVAVTGDPAGDFAGQNLLEQVMDDASGLNFKVKVVNPPLLDARGATVISDGVPVIIPPSLVSGQASAVFDTTGYNSINIRTYAAAGGTLQGSNDGVNWSSVQAQPINSSSAMSASLSASTDYTAPVLARYMRINNLSGANPVIVYLRTAQFTGPLSLASTTAGVGVNIVQLGSNSILSPGVGGVMPVAGITAPGGAATSANSGNPVGISGADPTPSGPLIRRILTDFTGAITIAGPQAGVAALGTTSTVGVGIPPQPLNATITGLGDNAGGDGAVTALNKIVQLLEMLDLRMQEMPGILTRALNGTGQIAANYDDFPVFRDDPTFWNQ